MMNNWFRFLIVIAGLASPALADCWDDAEQEFEAQIEIELVGDEESFDANDSDLLGQLFQQSYNDMQREGCDPFFRTIVDIVLEDEQDDERQLQINFNFTTAFSRLFRLTGKCRFCDAQADIFGNDAGRRLSSTLALGTEGFHQRALEDDGCSCAASSSAATAESDAGARAPTEQDFQAAFSQVVKSEIEAVSEITDIEQQPKQVEDTLMALLQDQSFDEGKALQDPSSVQYQALEWLRSSPETGMLTDDQLIQRYALVTVVLSIPKLKIHKLFPNKMVAAGELVECESKYVECNELGQVVAFQVSNVAKGGSIPPEIGHLVHLEDLTMTGCGLTGTIPTTVGQLVNLDTLDLSQNELSGAVPDEVCSNLIQDLVVDCSVACACCTECAGERVRAFLRRLHLLS